MPSRRTSRRALLALTGGIVWVVLTVLSSSALFLTSETDTVVAGHEAKLSPSIDRHVTLRGGPLLPDVRIAAPGRIGAEIVLGKTEAASPEELAQRYAFIASQPEGQATRIADDVRALLVSAVLRGAAVASLPILVWLLLGSARRTQLLRATRTRAVVPAVAVLALIVALTWQPWLDPGEEAEPESWTSASDFLGPEVPVPDGLGSLEVRDDPTTQSSRRLVQSAVDTYDKSQTWYADAAEAAEELRLRKPEDDEAVSLLVSDRHDNVGMDKVARAVADQGGATSVIDAGDDTSTGAKWEAFSLDSLTAAFQGFSKYAVTGNHDHGEFVGDFLDRHGWKMLRGELAKGPQGSTILGAPDPRSSGLGNWRDELGGTIGEQSDSLAEVACDADERVSLLVVHDANAGRDALDRGCVDLVVGGHTHVPRGPEQVAGENGEVGFRYTNGTTGGAAYAIAVGSKPRRDAGMALITWRDGRPVGLQAITLRTDGTFSVGDYQRMISDASLAAPAHRREHEPPRRHGR